MFFMTPLLRGIQRFIPALLTASRYQRWQFSGWLAAGPAVHAARRVRRIGGPREGPSVLPPGGVVTLFLLATSPARRPGSSLASRSGRPRLALPWYVWVGIETGDSWQAFCGGTTSNAACPPWNHHGFPAITWSCFDGTMRGRSSCPSPGGAVSGPAFERRGRRVQGWWTPAARWRNRQRRNNAGRRVPIACSLAGSSSTCCSSASLPPSCRITHCRWSRRALC